MKQLLRYFLRGLSAVLPAVLTVYILWWLGTSAEAVLGRALRLVLPEELYLPGMGLVAGITLIVLIGALGHAWFLRWVGRSLEYVVTHTPVVKSIYGALQDVISFLGRGDDKERMAGVVAVTVGDARLIGLVTRESVEDVLGDQAGRDTIAVYLPMGYQIGGFMVLVPRTSVTKLDLDVEEGLRLALTAGVRTNR